MRRDILCEVKYLIHCIMYRGILGFYCIYLGGGEGGYSLIVVFIGMKYQII